MAIISRKPFGISKASLVAIFMLMMWAVLGLAEQQLTGTDQDDVIEGSTLNDEIHGKAGADRFVATLPFGIADVVEDFEPEEGDTVWIDFGKLRHTKQGFPDKISAGNFELNSMGVLRIRLASGSWVEMFNMKRGGLTIVAEDFGKEVRSNLSAQF